MTRLATLLVRSYRACVSPLLGPRCKYHPTCSRYALDALHEFGFVRGTALAAWRILRCNPWSHGGVDFVRDQRLFPLRRRRPKELA
jgi:putative membrane protein insertion efficiency factor